MYKTWRNACDVSQSWLHPQAALVSQWTRHDSWAIVASIQPASSQVVCNDNIGNSIEHKLNVICICCTRLMAVDFFLWTFILGFELCLDVGSCFFVRLFAWKKQSTAKLEGYGDAVHPADVNTDTPNRVSTLKCADFTQTSDHRNSHVTKIAQNKRCDPMEQTCHNTLTNGLFAITLTGPYQV